MRPVSAARPVPTVFASALIAAVLAAAPAGAGVTEALDEVLLPGFASFADRTATLAETAARDCRAVSLRPAYQDSWDAWTRIGDLRIGPSEVAALSIAYWPDERGATPSSLSRLIAEEDPVGTDPAAYADVSIAARGLFALDQLLYGEDYADYADGSYTCTLVRTVTADLAAQAAALETGWADFGGVLTSAGSADNATFLDPQEAVRALYAQVLSGLEFTADARLGQPMGSFDRPRPRQAEAWRSGRPLANVTGFTRSAFDLAQALADTPLEVSQAALDSALDAAAPIGDPTLQVVEQPEGRLKVEILQQRVRALKDAIEAELGAPLGLTAGFNSSDGD